MSSTVDLKTARHIAVKAALLDRQLPPTAEGVVAVARHFGGIQIDPTRTVERTQHLVLWSRVPGYDRALLDQVLADRKAFEYNAFVVTPDRVPEILYVAKRWPPGGGGTWRQRARDFLAANDVFRLSILDQLRDHGPLQSRQIDDAKVVAGWQSSGWTQGKSTSQMLEFMSVLGDVCVSGRAGQERVWDLFDRVVPANAPRDELTEEEYQERRVMRAMDRFGVATQQEIRLRAYGLSIPAAKALLSRLVDEGRLVAVDLPYSGKASSAFALPAVLEAAGAASVGQTTLLSPFDPLVYDRDRTERLFGFKYKLEMYVPKAERQFGHFVLPILHDGELVGRLDSERDRKTNELQVIKLHWEEGAKPSAATKKAVDRAIAELAEFVRLG
ncbi:MAG TPA: crosslink repair DNA glycosylase YcaQ family protein [Candidatus Limnocylindrales bacterium]|nr:crosslink repair DNA glycosylase YcaQ family protein [Candidatus Limnocylindrales bacterium]